ncbi:N-acetylmuramoyl-L-alanine amidase [Phenylobacterium immobile]|uniref:N-acetylmuramoyl-L-alanine amidase n=1 Tax=Phenylobacterium immobile TaxID=21 RepID=UPI000A40DEE7|nr:N-acetylmuramoyl-L-alanine amidase [Phenylobacterium immobile]
MIEAPSPNFGPRKRPPDMVVLHYTGMRTGDLALARLRDPTAEVSAHYLVEEDGRVFRLVAEERRAWHAGRSFWRGESDINTASIGVEIVNPGHDHGYRPFPDIQIDAVIGLLDGIRARWSIDDRMIVGHADVAPDRKTDPGELFPWKRLAEASHGLWVEPAPAPGDPLTLGAEGPGVFALQAGFTRLGYDCSPSGQFDARTALVVTAFQRHWRPDLVDGVADGETRARLIALLRLT